MFAVCVGLYWSVHYREKRINILGVFSQLFAQHIWEHARLLLIGAIFTPSERTVTAAWRVMGLSMEKHFQNHH
jgi:hypothetical protein